MLHTHLTATTTTTPMTLGHRCYGEEANQSVMINLHCCNISSLNTVIFSVRLLLEAHATNFNAAFMLSWSYRNYEFPTCKYRSRQQPSHSYDWES